MKIMNFIKKYKNISQLKKNVFSGSILSGIDILVSMISYPIYLKYLGVEKYGLWTLVSIVLSLTQIGQFSIGTAIVKYVAGNYGKKDFKAITEYITTSIFILIVPSLIIIGVLSLFKTQIAVFIGVKEFFINDGERLVFFVGLLSVYTFFADLIKSVVIGIGRMDITNNILFFGRMFQIILSVCLLMLGNGIWSLYFGFLLYYVLTSMALFCIVKYSYHIKIFNPFAFRKEKLNELINFGGSLTLKNLVLMLVMPFNRVIISKYVGLSEVAYYQIAIQVISAVRGFFYKGLEALLPKISEIHSEGVGSVKSILSVNKKGIHFVFFGAFPLFLSIFIFANPILKLWLGKEFDIQIAIALKILLIGWFFNILTVPDTMMFIGIGKVNYSVIAACLKAVPNVIVIFVLIFLHIHFTLTKVVVIDSICLVLPSIYLKYKCFEYRKAGLASQVISYEKQ